MKDNVTGNLKRKVEINIQSILNANWQFKSYFLVSCNTNNYAIWIGNFTVLMVLDSFGVFQWIMGFLTSKFMQLFVQSNLSVPYQFIM